MCAKAVQPTQIRIELRYQSATDVFLQINKNSLNGMARSEKENSPRVNRDWKKTRKENAPISLKYLMVKELPSSLEDRERRELSVRTDPSNEDSIHVKQKIRILDNPKNLIEVLRTRLAIAQGLTGNNITTGPNQYHFTQTFLDGESLRIFDLKSTELRHETVANLLLLMDHVVN